MKNLTKSKSAMFASLMFLSTSIIAAPWTFGTGDDLSGGTPSAFSGEIEVVDDELTISLTNLSNAANGGFITAFAFNNPGFTAPVTLDTTSGLNNLLGGPDYIDTVPARPVAAFDIGASTGSSWLGGGSPVGGIGVGETGTFTFSFSDPFSLTTSSFVNALNEPNGEWLALRFRGFEDGGSSKYGAGPGREPDLDPIPLPAAVWLFGSGLVGLIGFSRRKSTSALQA